MWNAAEAPAPLAAIPRRPPSPPTSSRARRGSPATRPAAPLAAVLAALAAAVALVAASASAAAASPAPSRGVSEPSPSSSATPPAAEKPLLLGHKLQYEVGPEMPAFMKICRRGDPQLNACLRDSLNAFVRGAAAGLPAVAMPALDPLQIPFADLSGSAPGNITLSMVLRGVNVRGFSQSNITTVRANLEEKKFELMSRLPWMHADGGFDASGAVLTLPLSARGAFSVNMTDVSASWFIYFSERPLTSGGPVHFHIDHFEFDIAPADVTFKFGDTLDDDNQLGAAMNEFLNANALEVFGEVKERAAALLGYALRVAGESVFEAFPADRLLRPE